MISTPVTLLAPVPPTPSLLPPSSTAWERIASQALQLAGPTPLPSRAIWSWRDAPASTLPWLAWALRVQGAWGYSAAMAQPESTRRDLIRSSIALHRKKGTRAALVQMLDLLGVRATVSEWWQQVPAGAPYTFRLQMLLRDVPDGRVILTPALAARLRALVDDWKPARAHYTAAIGISLTARQRSAAVLRPAIHARIAALPRTHHAAIAAARTALVARPAQRMTLILLQRPA